MSMARAASEIEPCTEIISKSWILPGPSRTSPSTQRMKRRIGRPRRWLSTERYYLRRTWPQPLLRVVQRLSNGAITANAGDFDDLLLGPEASRHRLAVQQFCDR